MAGKGGYTRAGLPRFTAPRRTGWAVLTERPRVVMATAVVVFFALLFLLRVEEAQQGSAAWDPLSASQQPPAHSPLDAPPAPHTRQPPEHYYDLRPAAMDGMPDSAPLPFFIMGDWGSGCGDKFGQCKVATRLREEAETRKPAFLVSPGDQIYPWGVESVDDPLFRSRFEDVYPDVGALSIPWLMNIGNHDCSGNLDAQIAYSERSRRWVFPSRYYYTEHPPRSAGRGDPVARFIFLDTCSLVCAGSLDFRCEERLRKNVDPAAKRAQLEWLEDVLAMPARWKIVVGHWPIFSYFGNGPTEELISNLLPMLERHGVRLYIDGHDHAMQHITKPGSSVHCLVSGGGGWEIHPKLKHEDKAYLNDGTHLEFGRAAFGFFSARLTPAELSLTSIDTAGAELYTTSIPAEA